MHSVNDPNGVKAKINNVEDTTTGGSNRTLATAVTYILTNVSNPNTRVCQY